MQNQTSLDELLEQWDERRSREEDFSIEELCGADRTLLPVLKERVEQLKSMDWLDEAFSSADSAELEMSLTASHESPFDSRQVPSMLGERYKLEQLLAQGGFAQVWRAFDTTLERSVALKLTTVNSYAEARRVAQLKHQGIITVHDVGFTDGHYYIVFDYVDGITLAERITARTLTWRESVRILAHVADSVHFAHTKGFIHRDIKPSNILLDRTDQPILADFGIAITECDLRQEVMTSVGTLAYMAPEQLAIGGVIDVRTDVYGLGIVLYETLTACHPYSGGTMSELRSQILNGQPQLPRAIDPSVPLECEQICLRAMSVSKDARFTSALELAEALQSLLRSCESH